MGSPVQRRVGPFIGLWLLIVPALAGAQDLGHKLPGGIGIDAGTQGNRGVFLADRLVFYSAQNVRDRNGQRVPLKGLDIDAFANVLGVVATVRIPHGPYLNATFSFPVASISLNSTDPRASVDRFGFGDIYLMPVKVGWRLSRFDRALRTARNVRGRPGLLYSPVLARRGGVLRFETAGPHIGPGELRPESEEARHRHHPR